MKHIVFLGYIVPPSVSNVFSGLSVAGNKMQWNIIRCLSSYEDIVVDCVSVLPVAPFPKDKCLYCKTRTYELFDNVKTVAPGFCNVPAIKQIWQAIAVYLAAKKLINDCQNTAVLCYNLFPQIGLPMRWLKRKYPKCTFYTLLADLPIDDAKNRNVVSSWLRSIFDASTKKSISKCERFIILNEQVSKDYLKNQPYIVVDGGIEVPDNLPSIKPANKKNVLFCGALSAYNGIDHMLAAMELLTDLPIDLDIYGDGELKNEVIGAAEKNNKIHFFGRVPNDVVLKKQNEAWLLVNPRKADNPISKATFPSKIFEYLLSGTPVLSTHLNCFGEEYDELLFFCEDSPNGIASSIREIFFLPDENLEETAKRAQKFVTEKRSWENQTAKIYGFLIGDTKTENRVNVSK